MSTTTGANSYRTKQVEFDAIQFLGESNCNEVHVFLGLEHPDVEDHELIDLSSRGGWQSVAVGDWIVCFEDGNYEAFTDDEFRDEFEPADGEPELGWDETVIRHPTINQLRIPLNHNGNDAGELVLDDKQAGKLAAEILNMLAEDQPAQFVWGRGVEPDNATGCTDIPVYRGNAWIGHMRLSADDLRWLTSMLGKAGRR